MKFDVKFWCTFPCYVFQGLGVRRKISPKFHVKNSVKNGQFHANFTLLGRSADTKLALRAFPLTPEGTQAIARSPWCWLEPRVVLRMFATQSISRRRKTGQQLTCSIDLSCFFYYFFFSFVLLELKPFVLRGKVLGKKFEKVRNDFAL